MLYRAKVGWRGPDLDELLQETKDYMAEMNEGMLFANGFDEALIGFVECAGRESVALYDRHKCIEVLMDRDGMSLEDASEYLDFNTIGAYVGENTPAFATLIKDMAL